MMYIQEVIDAIGKEILLLRTDNEYYKKNNERLEKENADLREQIERMIKEQVLDHVFGEGQNG